MFSKQRVLVVENLDDLRQTYVTSLELDGYAVDGAGSLQEALDLIDAALKGDVGLRPEWMRAL